MDSDLSPQSLECSECGATKEWTGQGASCTACGGGRILVMSRSRYKKLLNKFRKLRLPVAAKLPPPCQTLWAITDHPGLWTYRRNGERNVACHEVVACVGRVAAVFRRYQHEQSVRLAIAGQPLETSECQPSSSDLPF
jgi:DNA-directed RNA polymerase subunit RPC12/RpoP